MPPQVSSARMPSMERADFPFAVSERLRFGDTDMLGHVNNAVFATLFESGRVAFLFNPHKPLAPAGHHFVIARLSIDFLAELNWPGEVEVATGVARIGRTSITLRSAVFVGETCAATADSVIVLVDSTTRKAAPLPDATRSALGDLMVTVSGA